MDGFKRDAIFGWRRLRATPAFTIFALITLAMGIGVTTAIWSIVRVVMGPPPGVRDPGTIINVNHAPRGGIPIIKISWPDYQDFKAHQTVSSDVTAWSYFRQANTANGRADTAFGEIVGGEYFQVLGVQAAVGRTLQPAEPG